jgi:hypothetical protein
MWNPPYAVGDCRGPAPFVAGIIVHRQDSKPDYARVTQAGSNPKVSLADNPGVIALVARIEAPGTGTSQIPGQKRKCSERDTLVPQPSFVDYPLSRP